ncbi:DUF6476 family protein [Sulfitobacter sp. LCG007]
MEHPEPTVEPANLRFLRRLVTVLTAVMIAGVLLIIVLIVIRMSDETPRLPDSIVLPGNARAVALTQGPGWYAVVTDGDQILIFDSLTGGLRQTVQIESGNGD